MTLQHNPNENSESMEELLEELRSGEFAPLANRIEAAWKRKIRDSELDKHLAYHDGSQTALKIVAKMSEGKVVIGNSAAMHEALTKVSEWMAHRIATGGFEASPTIPTVLEDVVLPALSAPPRNCDRFNTGNPMKDAEDAYGAWQRYCDDPTIPPSCKIESAFRQWLFATAKETKGEDYGSK